MKRKLLILSLISFFLFLPNASAGVCDGKQIVTDDGYCKLDKSLYFVEKNIIHSEAVNGKYPEYFLYSVYKLDGNNSYSGADDYAFCLDPNLHYPTGKVNYARELSINNSLIQSNKKEMYDRMVYTVYIGSLEYYKAYNIQKTHNENTWINYLKHVDSVYRYLTSSKGYSYDSLDGKKFNYTYHDLSYSGSEKVVSSLSFFNFLKKMSGSFDYVWKNPLTITKKVNYNDVNQEYVYTFEVYFGNKLNPYFAGYDIGYGPAYFKIDKLDFGSGKYGIDNARAVYINDKALEDKSDINGKNYESINTFNNTLYIKVLVTKEMHDTLEADGGSYLNLHYETYNPLSSDNVFVTREWTGKDPNETKTQRMIVFTKYKDIKTVRSDNAVVTEKEDPVSYCEQKDNSFYYQNKQVELDDYITNCSCLNVSSDLLRGQNITIYNNHCSEKPTVSVNSKLKDCGKETGSSDDNTITYRTTNPINNYCSLDCTETAAITGMTDKFSTIAGRYYELKDVLTVNSTKKCTVKIKYDTFDNNYKTLLKEAVDAYNDWQKDLALSKASPTTIISGDTRKTVYYYSYDKLTVDSSNVISSTKVGPFSSDTKSTNVSVSSKKAIFLEKNAKIIGSDSKNSVFTAMDTCHNYLKKMNNFYDVSNNKVNFYYYQDIVNKSNKEETVKNNGDYFKDLYFDDSELKQKQVSKSETGNYSSYSTKQYSYLDNSGSIQTRNIGYSSSELYRQIEYKTEYNADPKYVNSYTGIISNQSGKNRVLNADGTKIIINTFANTIEKTNNLNYYYFEKLGDNNVISDYIEEKSNINSDNGYDELTRKCNYDITNELYDCKSGECPSNKKPTLNAVFRIVDPKNIDPNNRLVNKKGNLIDQSSDNGFKNWRNELGLKTKQKIESTDTYNPVNLEYSFTLNSKTIQEIREYNADVDYSNVSEIGSRITCDSEGNNCTSEFIDNAINKLYGKVINGIKRK